VYPLASCLESFGGHADLGGAQGGAAGHIERSAVPGPGGDRPIRLPLAEEIVTLAPSVGNGATRAVRFEIHRPLIPRSSVQFAIPTPRFFHVLKSPIPNPQSPIRNPQSAIPNPQSEIRNPLYPLITPSGRSLATILEIPAF
jgi:hypothetical protein